MKKILLIYTGGTIGMVKDEKGALVPFKLENILSKIPALENFPMRIDTVSIDKPKDSANFMTQDWQSLGRLINERYQEYFSFVVLHGTDTMAYTASAISFFFQNLKKPIVFTGSQLPIDDLRSDAVKNVMESLTTAMLSEDGKAILSEVVICFGGKVLRANRSTKISSESFQAFDSPNYPVLINFGVGLNIRKTSFFKPNLEEQTIYNDCLMPGVFIVSLHPGWSPQYLEFLIENDDIKVLLMQTYGAGTFISESWFVDLLKSAKQKGKYIINKSQCMHGEVKEGLYAAGADFEDLGMISAQSMTLEAVVAKSMCLLGVKNQKIDFEKAFKTSFSGETD